MAKDISIEIEATNLGPHRSLKAKDQISSLELGIFANNGSGKTFLSRAFRLIGNVNLKVDETNKLLTLGQSQAQFKIAITNTKEPGVIREVKIQFNRNTIPTISNTTDYTFHVFNREYVKENLEELKYRPSGKIEGFILGKEKIDLTKEREELEKLSNDYSKKIEKVSKSVDEALGEIDTLNVRRNTTEYVALSYENIISAPDKFNESETFDSLKAKHSKLKSIPDNLPDVVNVNTINSPAFLQELIQYLSTSYNKSSIAEDFKKKVKVKQTFIESGLRIIGSEKTSCPFCEQELKDEALRLIDEYVKYLNDTEALQITRGNKFLEQLAGFYEGIKQSHFEFLKVKEKFNNIKSYLPSFEGVELVTLNDTQELEPHFDALAKLIASKKEDVAHVVSTQKSEAILNKIQDWVNVSNECIKSNGQLIESLNSKKQNLQSERLELNKRLCRSKYSELGVSQKQTIAEIKELRIRISELERQIQSKEQSEKVSKKEKVAETFKYFLSLFFDKKYSFDDSNFCLKFLDHSLTENASDVLSDGEKSIVAFCYFLAETHKLIEKEDDYQKLFFVIDDPISSLDFHYVYSVAQAIRSLNKFFPLARIRYLVLTHNLEFMSILIRNNIVNHRYFLESGKISELKRNLIMPYEEHLRDIYNVAKSNSEPSHTTPNSIRHVLETINRFVAPNVEFSKFCDQVEGFQDSAFLYSLIHDSSHGGIRSQRAYTSEMVKTGCELIIKYLEKNYTGQVELLKT